MAQAEIHGKMSPSSDNAERMEDVLTSEVFERLRYIPSELGLFPLIKRVKWLCGQGITLDATHALADVLFWPPLPNSEPDTVVSIKSSDGDKRGWLVLFEVKYHSGLSGNDQLLKEYQDLVEYSSGVPLPRRCLVFLTDGMGTAQEALAATCRTVLEKHMSEGYSSTEVRSQFGWLDWRDVFSALRRSRDSAIDGHHRAVLDDLVVLLERRGVSAFDGFKLPSSRLQLPPPGEPIFYSHAKNLKEVRHR